MGGEQNFGTVLCLQAHSWVSRCTSHKKICRSKASDWTEQSLTRYLRVGMAARIRVSSVMCWLLSRGTFKSARTCKVIIFVCKAMTRWNKLLAEILPYCKALLTT